MAAKGHNHLKIIKTYDGDNANINLVELQKSDKILEIARMISGEDITEEAISAAKKLME